MYLEIDEVVSRIADRVTELYDMSLKAPLSQHALGEMKGLNFAATCLREACDRPREVKLNGA